MLVREKTPTYCNHFLSENDLHRHCIMIWEITWSNFGWTVTSLVFNRTRNARNRFTLRQWRSITNVGSTNIRRRSQLMIFLKQPFCRSESSSINDVIRIFKILTCTYRVYHRFKACWDTPFTHVLTELHFNFKVITLFGSNQFKYFIKTL